MKWTIKNLFRMIPIAIALLGGVEISHATQIMPASYDMPNGYGTSVGGMFNYWDANYTGSGATTTDGAPLTGGLGKLTDGIIATESWLWTDMSDIVYTAQNLSGTGPYVGWTWGDPTIIFHFANLVSIETISFYVDNPANGSDGYPRGGVCAPKSFTINGTEISSGVDNTLEGSGPLAISFTDLGLMSVDLLTVTINRDISGDHRFWVFLSEVTFDDQSVPVPEPSTMMLIAPGIAGLALMRNRRRKV